MQSQDQKQISPSLPFKKGGTVPSLEKGGLGRIFLLILQRF